MASPRAILPASLLLIGLFGNTGDAAACFDDRCTSPDVLVGERVPVNAPGFHVSSPPSDEGPTHFLKRIDPDAEDDIELKRVRDALLPMTPLVLGGHYVLRTVESCGGIEEIVEQHFVAVEAAPLPSDLFLFEPPAEPYSAAVTALDVDGVCIESTTPGAPLDIALAPEWHQWSSVLVWETLVDGEIWAPRNPPAWTESLETASYQGAVYGACPEAPNFTVEDGVAPGEHVVSVRVSIPGSDIVVESNEVRVNIICGCPAGQAWDSWSGSCVDDYPVDDWGCAPGSTGDYSGCPRDYVGGRGDDVGCSATGEPASHTGALLSILVLLVCRRRRRD